MVTRLSEVLFPGEEGSTTQRQWAAFIEFMELTDEERTASKNIFEVFRILMRKQDIQHGSYGIVKAAFSELKLNDCLKIVKTFEDSINERSTYQQGIVIFRCKQNDLSAHY